MDVLVKWRKRKHKGVTKILPRSLNICRYGLHVGQTFLSLLNL